MDCGYFSRHLLGGVFRFIALIFFVLGIGATGLGQSTNIQIIARSQVRAEVGRIQGDAVAIDREGNFYVGGVFTGTVDFGSKFIMCGGRAAFLVKYRPDGTEDWVLPLCSTASTRFTADPQVVAIGVDGDGFAYLTVFTDNALPSLIFKISPAGKQLWSREIGSYGRSAAAGVNDTGHIFVVGHWTADDPLNPGNYLVKNLLKLDSGGNPVWQSEYPWRQEQNVTPSAAALDRAGNAYVAGSFRGVVEFAFESEEHTLFSRGSSDMFIGKYDSTGKLEWVTKAGDPPGSYGLEKALAMALDDAGNSFVLCQASVSGSIPRRSTTRLGFGDTLVTNAIAPALILAKYDNSGKTLWARPLGADPEPFARYNMVTDHSGNVYLSGFHDPLVRLASSKLHHQFVVSKYDAAGQLLWVQRAGGNPDSNWVNAYPRGIALDPSGTPVVVGYFQAFAPFGSIELRSSNVDMFVARFNEPSVLPPVAVSVSIGTVELSWPASITNVLLLRTLDFGVQPLWSVVANTPTVRDGRSVIVLAPDTSTSFFKLEQR